MKRFLVPLNKENLIKEKKSRFEECVESNNENVEDSVSHSETLDQSESRSETVEESESNSETVEKNESLHIKKNDIANFINKSLTDNDRRDLLRNMWVPPKNYKYPILEKFEQRRLRFCHKWLDEFSWLAYSELQQGAFCAPCVLFAKGGGQGCQPLGALVKTKFNNWKKAKETYKEHEKKAYHIRAVGDKNMFLRIQKNTHESVENLLDQSRKEQIYENRKNIVPIIEAVIVLGRQEMGFRGHRDSGVIDIESNYCGPNEGNFRAILKYRAKGDAVLAAHLSNTGKRNKYISPSVQNEMIDACYTILTTKVLNSVKKAKFFSVLVDETTDVATIEQVTMCVRYVHESNEKHTLREEFIKFIPTSSTTGVALATLIIDQLKECNLDVSYLIGQGYDGASNMSGRLNGVQAIVREKHAPHALYLHCAAHSLNLAISITSKIPAIRDCLSTIEKIYDFFNTPKRKSILEKIIDDQEESPKIRSLKRLNLTRWVAKYEAVNDFIELFPYVLEALEDMRKTERDAKALRSSMDFEFIISLRIINHIFSFSLPLSRELQKTNIDLTQAVLLAETLRKELKKSRDDDSYTEIYKKANDIAIECGIDVIHKRVVRKQTNRSNPDVNTTEDYFRITIFYAFIDFFVMELGEKFTKHGNILQGFSTIFKWEETVDENLTAKFIETANFYSKFLDADGSAVSKELKMWKLYAKHVGSSPPSNALEALDNCPDNFPNVRVILQILATLPVSTSTPERTFSALKRIKTIQRNSIKEDRLNGLAALALHREIDITPQEVIDELAKIPRRIGILL